MGHAGMTVQLHFLTLFWVSQSLTHSIFPHQQWSRQPDTWGPLPCAFLLLLRSLLIPISLLPNPTNKTLSFLISMHSHTSHHITFSQTHLNPTQTTLKPHPQQHGEQNHHPLSKASTFPPHFPNHDDPFRWLPRRRFSNAGSQEQPQPAGVDRRGPMHVGPCQVLRR